MATSSYTALAEKFYVEFRLESEAIGAAIDAQRDAFLAGEKTISADEHLAKIAALQRKVQDAVVYTNNHDQRVYTTTIKSLQEKLEGLRNLVKPKSKFSFKSARKAAPKTNAATPTTVSEAAPKANKVGHLDASSGLNDLIGNGSEVVQASNIYIPDQRLQNASTAAIQNVSQSIIHFTVAQEKTFDGLHVVNVADSIVFCGSIDGGLHITGVKSSVLIASTHQFRMHKCNDVVIYLAAGSSPIIEDCSGIKFCPLPTALTSASLGISRNSWDEVLDFQYPGLSGPSPNWMQVPEEERMSLDKNVTAMLTIDGKLLGDLKTSQELQDCLEQFGIGKGSTSNSQSGSRILATSYEKVHEAPGTSREDKEPKDGKQNVA